MMNCKESDCGKRARVLETRSRDGYVYRRYTCGAGHKFSTVESVCDSGMAKRIRKSDIQRTIRTDA